MTDAAGAASVQQPDDAEEQLKRALTAFKKRFKLTKLDQESKLGGMRPMTGKPPPLTGIVPPREFPMSVWQELAKQGKIKDAGGGFFRLP